MRLRRDLHWCLCGERVVLLDLREDRYLCLPQGLEPAFLRAAEGRCAIGDREKLYRLIERGLLLEGDGDDRPPPDRTPLAAPVADILGSTQRRANAVDVLRALALDLWAARQLRRKPLSAVMSGVRGRSQGLRTSASGLEDCLERTVSAFAAIGFVSPEADRCLVRAIAVHTACCRIGVGVRLVIGVQLHPFQAHAWVQLDDRVLTGGAEQARLFTPIAVVG